MKYLEMLDPVVLKTFNGTPLKTESGLPVFASFRDFILSRLEDASFGRDMASIMSAVKIRDVVIAATDVIALEDADYARLVVTVKQPASAYNAAIAHNLIGFMDEICHASDKPPVRAVAAE